MYSKVLFSRKSRHDIFRLIFFSNPLFSGNLDEMIEVLGDKDDDETTHRRNLPFFGNVMQSGGGQGVVTRRPPISTTRGQPTSALTVNSVQHSKISPTGGDAAAESFNNKKPGE